ncbi:MAG TPA: S26 family signal peptidase [Candidatus Angelobacter sp.]|nr:S26 family signal peptidase [Candidatus Angelobacter sp.]
MRYVRGPVGPLAACLALVALGWAAALTWRIAARQLDVVEVRGRSMAPTLLPGDRMLAALLHRRPRIGEIVITTDPRDPAREIVKRVWTVGPAGIEVRGDNPAWSTDARAFGVIPVSRVRWTVVARLWPPGRIGRIGRVGRVGSFGRGAARNTLEEGGESACPVPEHLVTDP